MSDLDLEISNLRVQQLSVYKVTSKRATLREYNESRRTGADQRTGDFVSDWQAMYMQVLAEHTLGTVAYRWTDFSEATLVKATFSGGLDVVKIDGRSMHDGAISGEAKARAIKNELGIEQQQPLMTALGEQKKCALIRETEAEWELIVSHEFLAELTAGLTYCERPIAHFAKHSMMPVTAKWSLAGVENWQKWEEGLIPREIPDLDASWI